MKAENKPVSDPPQEAPRRPCARRVSENSVVGSSESGLVTGKDGNAGARSPTGRQAARSQIGFSFQTPGGHCPPRIAERALSPCPPRPTSFAICECHEASRFAADTACTRLAGHTPVRPFSALVSHRGTTSSGSVRCLDRSISAFLLEKNSEATPDRCPAQRIDQNLHVRPPP